MKAKLRRASKQLSFKTFILGDRVGLHVLPKHYYSPVQDMTWLRQNQRLWAKPLEPGVLGWDLNDQLQWLADTCGPYRSEVAGFGPMLAAVAEMAGPGYGPVESQVLHCFIRKWRPARIIEVGSGVSTMCALHAARINATESGVATRQICIEPNPSPALRRAQEISLVDEEVQAVDPDLFEDLQSGDLLFIDSSHAVKTGSDVHTLLFQVLPRLEAGVFVHFHDIYLPYLYPRDTLSAYFGSQETAMLAATLMGNRHLKVLAGLAALHYAMPEKLRAILPDYRPSRHENGLGIARDNGHFPSSLYLRAEDR